MPSKTVEIDFKKIGAQIQESFKQAQAWLENFFKTMDDHEKLATAGVGLGFVLFIIGVIIV